MRSAHRPWELMRTAARSRLLAALHGPYKERLGPAAPPASAVACRPSVERVDAACVKPHKRDKRRLHRLHSHLSADHSPLSQPAAVRSSPCNGQCPRLRNAQLISARPAGPVRLHALYSCLHAPHHHRSFAPAQPVPVSYGPDDASPPLRLHVLSDSSTPPMLLPLPTRPPPASPMLPLPLTLQDLHSLPASHACHARHALNTPFKQIHAQHALNTPFRQIHAQHALDTPFRQTMLGTL